METPDSQVLFFSGKDKVAAVGGFTVGVGGVGGVGVGAALSPPPEQAASPIKNTKAMNRLKFDIILLLTNF
jgi:hypothetical protein